MPAEHQRLDRQQQRLDPQQQGMHESRRIDGVQRKTLQRSGFRIGDDVMVAGVGIDDAGAARRNTVEAVLVERLKEREDARQVARQKPRW